MEVQDRGANPPIAHTLVSGTPKPTQDEASQAFGSWQQAS